MSMERRIFASNIELRAGSGGKPSHLMGYASVCNSPSEDLGGFTETIKNGAFSDALASDELDCRMLFNHDPNMVLGRTPDSLTLREDSTGLYYDAIPPKTSYAADVFELIDKKMVTQCSFGFTVLEDEWYDQAGNRVASWSGTRRVITKIGRLFDTSIVTYPAYAATSVSARSAFLFPDGKGVMDGEQLRAKAKSALALMQRERAADLESKRQDAIMDIAAMRRRYNY